MELTPFDSLYPADSRFDEIEKMISIIKEGNSCQLIGIPGVGRSNLLGFLAYNQTIRKKHLGEQEKQFHFVMINFAELKKRSFFDVSKIIFLTIIESLKNSPMQDVYEKANGIFKESLSYQDELILFQGLKTILDIIANEKDITLVLLLERFEDYVPMLTAEFFTNLRILRNRAKYHFSVVFSLNRSLEELIEPSMMADFYEFVAGHSIYLPIADAPGNAFRIAYLEKATGKTISKEMVDKIITYTAGHGKLTRVCIEVVLSKEETSIGRENEEMENFLQNKKIQAVLREIWYALSPLEQTCLASDEPCEHTDPTYLEYAGICQNKKIAIPLLTAFAQEQASKMRQESQTIIFHPETNTITKGSLVLSDTLTVSEFRLLEYFIAHKDVIVTKEQIITAVWQDAKSTAGVTDQALDQLIFRLRKKIEDDPNNPQHIQTIKGRGIKFIQ